VSIAPEKAAQREADCRRLFAEGLSRIEIGRQLGIHRVTVRRYLPEEVEGSHAPKPQPAARPSEGVFTKYRKSNSLPLTTVERELAKPMHGQCSFCDWELTGVAADVIDAYAEHRERREGRPTAWRSRNPT
jgi:hypothetical protein